MVSKVNKKYKVIEKVAFAFHEKWRENRLQSDGKYKSMMEKSEDEEWNINHWTDVVDIANTEFEDLPSNRKYENLEAAKLAVDLVYDSILAWKQLLLKDIEEMSKIVHEKWLERNWIKWSFENQRVDYENLSEEEKAKDRIQIELVIQIIKLEI